MNKNIKKAEGPEGEAMTRKFKCPKCGKIIKVSSDDIIQNASVYCKAGHYISALKLIAIYKERKRNHAKNCLH